MPLILDTDDDGQGSNPTGVYVLEVYEESPDLPLFIDLITNACGYKGSIIYLKRLENIPGREPWPDPFLFENKFYFNEDCEWFESPFSLNGVFLG